MRETVGVAIAAVIGVAAFGAPIVVGLAGIGSNNQQRMLEATVRMERLATELEHANQIAPETKLEVTRVIHYPWFDCKQMACRKTLEMRNRAARERLQAALDRSKTATEMSAATAKYPR